MSKLRVNSISDRSDEAAPSLTFGATIPSGEVLTIAGNLNTTGIQTVGILSVTSGNVTGVVTATKFVGDGSALTNLPNATKGFAIAMNTILDPLPFRS